MKLTDRLFFARRIVLAVLWVGGFAFSGIAQQLPPTPPNPAAPVLNPVVPLGMQRGTSLELTLTGTNLAEPTGVWTSFPARITIPADKNNGKEAGKLRVHIDVPKDAPLGFHSLRVATTRGISNFRLFCIDDLPQIMEIDSNRLRSTPQSVPVPCVVVGRADAELADYYRINVKAGEHVSFEVLGRRLGSGLDPQLTLLDPRSGRELPGGHNNDAPGLQTDPRLTYTFKEAGDYLIEVRDTMWRGGGDFWYRLRIGDFPCATTPIPMAARRGSQVSVAFAGPNVDGVLPVEVAVPDDPNTTSISIAPRGTNGLYGWPVVLALSDHEEMVEHEPNNDPGHANRVPVPGGVTGRFLEPGDVDFYVVAATKGQRLIIDADTLSLNSPTEVYLVLKDSKGNQLAASNPQVGPRLDFTAPADGDYTLGVEHLLNAHGTSESYRITIVPFTPGFDLTLGIERFDVAPGSVTAIPVYAQRHGYAGPIDVRVVGDPHISGRVTIVPGQPAAPNQPAATLFLSAAADAPPGPYNVAIEGCAVSDGKSVVQNVNLKALISQNLAGLAYPPQSLFSHVGVAVTQKPPFTLAAHFDRAEGIRGQPIPLTIRATRVPGFTGEISLSAVGLPSKSISAAIKNIPSGHGEVKGQLNAAVNAGLGSFPVGFTGKTNFQGRDFSVTTQPILLVLVPPFDLHIDAIPVKLLPGGKAKIKVTATRNGGYQGAIALEVRNLPALITGAKTTIAAGQDAVDVELSATANAPAAEKADVKLLGTATAAGNQQQASASFLVSVVKK
jgi:hypothetical protein